MRHKYWHIAFLLINLMKHDNINSWADNRDGNAILLAHTHSYRAFKLNELIWLKHQKSEIDQLKANTAKSIWNWSAKERSLTLSKLKLITDHLPRYRESRKAKTLCSFISRQQDTHGMNTHLHTSAHRVVDCWKWCTLRAVIHIICLFSSFVWIRNRKADRERVRGETRGKKSKVKAY